MKKKKAKKINFKKHLFRASSFGNLMGDTKCISNTQLARIDELEAKKIEVTGVTGKQQEEIDRISALDNPTPKQLKTVEELEAKKTEVKGLPPGQVAELAKLIYTRDKPLELSKGAKTYLKKLYRELKYNRRAQLKSKYLEKGLDLEEEAITMLTLHKGKYFTNNKERVNNSWFSGEVDVLEGYDTKCSWNLDSFPLQDDPLPAIYKYQNLVYMDLHKKKEWSTVYCLIDATKHALDDMIYREGFRQEWAGKDLPKWKKLEILNLNVYTEAKFFEYMKTFDCIPDEEDGEKAIDIVNNFVEIPVEKRLIEKVIEWDSKEIKLMHQVVKLAREELIRLDKM